MHELVCWKPEHPTNAKAIRDCHPSRKQLQRSEGRDTFELSCTLKPDKVTLHDNLECVKIWCEVANPRNKTVKLQFMFV